LIGLITPLIGLASSFIKSKAAQSKAKQEVKLKIIKSEENWDSIVAKGSSDSWKDEYFVIVLSIPMIGAFIPSVVPYIQEGFIVLDTMPDYYKGFLGAAIAASFGIKSLSKWKK
tara:strand:+ start:522 stop:863 length:342 start_codon:yes stop_codon:yes gene_type:complete